MSRAREGAAALAEREKSTAVRIARKLPEFYRRKRKRPRLPGAVVKLGSPCWEKLAYFFFFGAAFFFAAGFLVAFFIDLILPNVKFAI
jgi:hypothetical protein